jgi:AraC family transcriptional regulator
MISESDEVADAAGYSYYHFHRIFEAALGETVGNYIRSRRLCRAAGELLYTDKKILDMRSAISLILRKHSTVPSRR